MLFLAMGSGLITGMGYIGYALLFAVIMSLVCVLYNCMGFGLHRSTAAHKTLQITIPESLDYSAIFDDIFAEYTTASELVRVKTTNMGSLFRLTYHVTLRDADREKEMIDKLRCRNGNLEISLSNQEMGTVEL